MKLFLLPLCVTAWYGHRSVQTTSNRDCIDQDLADICQQTCFDELSQCLVACGTDDACKTQCARDDYRCVDACPCNANCINGCKNCPNPICPCQEPNQDPYYIRCRVELQTQLEKCLIICPGGDEQCVEDCGTVFVYEHAKCPCMDKCRRGCPCAEYDCYGEGLTSSSSSTTT